MNPFRLSIAETARAFASGELTPTAVAEQRLERIHSRNEAINAFTFLDEDAALRSAAESTRRWRAKEQRGSIDGQLFAAKDNMMVSGYPCRRGSLLSSAEPVQETAPVVARCLEKGAAFIGLTTMPEFGAGPITISPLSGTTFNAWDSSRHAGGSSGGAAAAVASGFCAFALASDAGGSIRTPSALNGVVGFKPSGGMVPMYPASPTGFISAVGPICRSVDDVAVLMPILSQPDLRDPSANKPDVDFDGLHEGVDGWRIALSMTLGYAKKIHSDIERLVGNAATRFRDLGANVDELDPGIEDPIDHYVVLLGAGYQYALRAIDEERRRALSQAVIDCLPAKPISLERYLASVEHCQMLAQTLAKRYAHYRVLITPTVAWPAFDASRTFPEEFEQYSNRRAWAPFTSLFNLTRQPAITVPIGLTTDGLPVGLQIVGAYGDDRSVLIAAAAIEKAMAFDRRIPA